MASVNELPWCSATQLLHHYATGALSPVDVMKTVIALIERSEPHLSATYAFTPEQALAAAHDAEQRWQHATPQGPLDGVPVLLKENIATAGTPIPQGTAASELTPASCDAPITTRLATAGAVLLGKTTMPDLGMLTSGLSSFHHLTRNPWNTELTPGGSSAGAAAGAAAGYGPLHVGTDIGGSIRLPAGWCGLVGFKPSFGRIPVTPPYLGRTAGPLTPTVADAALLSEVLAGPDSRDHMSLPHQPIPWTQLQHPLAGLRVGLLMNPGVGLAVDPQVHDAVTAAAERFENATKANATTPR